MRGLTIRQNVYYSRNILPPGSNIGEIVQHRRSFLPALPAARRRCPDCCHPEHKRRGSNLNIEQRYPEAGRLSALWRAAAAASIFSRLLLARLPLR
jgi:hypothetical protein